jgi:hypothetical protein
MRMVIRCTATSWSEKVRNLFCNGYDICIVFVNEMPRLLNEFYVTVGYSDGVYKGQWKGEPSVLELRIGLHWAKYLNITGSFSIYYCDVSPMKRNKW